MSISGAPGASGGLGLFGKVTKTVARIRSQNRTAGANGPSDFSVYMTPQVSRAVAFTVQSVEMDNSWYTISKGQTDSAWIWNDGTDHPVTISIPPGYYPSPGGQDNDIKSGPSQIGTDKSVPAETAIFNAFSSAFAIAMTGAGAIAQLTRTNQIQWTTATNTTVTFVSGPLGAVLGIPPGLSYGSTVLGTFGPPRGEDVTDYLNADVYDPESIDLVSGQLMELQNTDTRTNGGNNAFQHIFVDQPKNSTIRYEVISPYESNMTKLTAPTDFQFLRIAVTNSSTGLPVQVLRDWEMTIWFWCVPSP